MSNIEITKEAAAQRQIDAAIRMVFLHGEDLLAVHTVAAAARGIVRYLAKDRGVGHPRQTRLALEEVLREALAAVARAKTGDALEEGHRDVLAQAAQPILEGLKAANGGVLPEKIRLELHDLDPTNPQIAADLDSRANLIERDGRTREQRNKAANFLKHADKDPKSKLNLGELNALGLIADACNMWFNMQLPVTDEMQFFHIWFRAVFADKPEHVAMTKSGPIHQLTFEQQVDAGRWLLKQIYARQGRSADWFRDDAGHNMAELAAFKMTCALE
jgi:hypothetical protein